jgi:hypothetical protein
MRYYDGCCDVNVDDETDGTVVGDECSAAACAEDEPLAWSKLEMSAVRARPARVPTTHAVTRKPSLKPSPHDVVTAALEGRLRNHDAPGVSLGYLGPVGGRKMPSEKNVYDEELEAETVLSEKPEPEREVAERAKELYSKVDQLGQLQYEGRWISHAYRPSTSRVNNRRGAVSTVADTEVPAVRQDPRRAGRQQKGVVDREGGSHRARAAYISGGLSQPQGLMQKDEGKRRRSQVLPGGGLGSNKVVDSCMDVATAAAAAVAALAAEMHSGVSAEQAAAALAQTHRLAREREYGWQLEAAKLGETRLIASHSGKRRGTAVAVDKKKRASLWDSTRDLSTSVCVIC